ncbi:MAG: hypothetical protein CL843_16500 [Crocinitomicaceae bacterium]|nr:hypothetical protein [Crocinitomicaceae bacterium]
MFTYKNNFIKSAGLIFGILSGILAFGQNQNLSNGLVFDGEPYIAINPNNAQHLVVAWMGWINLSNQFKIKTKTSFDGGQTWSAATELPHTVSNYSSADPSLAFNLNNEVFACYIDFTGTTPPVTGGVYLCKSTDGGLSWNTPTTVITTNYDGSKWPIDRPWMAIDQSSSAQQGNIYITTMNLNRTDSPYNPYFSVSTDNGASFSTRYLDTANWLAGSINPLPMCSPTVSSDGTFYGAYPSYVITQSFYAQSFLATSDNGGANFAYSNIITFNSPTQIDSYPSAKKASQLLSDPSDPNHLAYIYLSAIYGDLDVFFIESFNAGNSWSSPLRLNDDTKGNNIMQDLIWGDFDQDGDLVISWRDRRNGSDTTYQTATEIWATYRGKNATTFTTNFQLSSELVTYDSVLESSGNDFMSIQLQNDTIHAVWGDTRNGKLNIWYQNSTTGGTLISVKAIASEPSLQLHLYPNPTNGKLTLEGLPNNATVTLYNNTGKQILQQHWKTNTVQLALEHLSPGHYLLKVNAPNGVCITRKVVKQ